MIRKTDNDIKLSEYFQKCSMEQTEIPYMTKITKDTGVSVSTISRFAQRSGFYNFAEMRAKFNVKLGDSTEIFNNDGLSNFIKKAKSIFIIPSVNTVTLGYHLRERLNEMKINTDMRHYKTDKVTEFSRIPKDASVIVFTLSGRSLWYEEYVKFGPKNKTLLVTTSKHEGSHPKIKVINKPKFEFGAGAIQKNKSIRKLLNWIDDACQEMQIGKFNTKKHN